MPVKKKPSPAQLAARAKFVAMVRARAAAKKKAAPKKKVAPKKVAGWFKGSTAFIEKKEAKKPNKKKIKVTRNPKGSLF